MRIISVCIITAITLLAGCSRAPVVTITNDSTTTLSNVVVSGSGFSEHIGSVAPGGKHKLTVQPVGESGLRVEFDADGRHIDSGEQGYFEGSGSYRVTASVNSKLSVSVASELSEY